MSRITPNVDEAANLLSNPLLNRITKTNTVLYYITYTFLICYFIFEAQRHHGFFSLILCMLIGVTAWTLFEYTFHRYLFHWKSENKISKIITFMFHGVHHASPKDVSRSITPLIFSLPLAFGFIQLFKFIFPNQAEGLMAGFLFGYLLYTTIHDSTHHFPLDYPVLKRLKRNHMRHHFFDNNKNFGVTTPLWDFIFKTYTQSDKLEMRANLE